MNEIEMLKERIASMENDVKPIPRNDCTAETIATKISAAMDDAREINIRTLAMIGFITGKRPEFNDPKAPECLEDSVNITRALLRGSVENLEVIMGLLGA